MMHEHGHEAHAHHHPHGTDKPRSRALAVAGAANLGWALAQGLAGAAIGSTALMTDSVHNLGDAAGLVLAWGAAVLASRKATSRRTWGWHRAEQLAGFANAILVVIGALAVGLGALWKLSTPSPLDGLSVSAWALGGIAVNALSAWWISGHGRDLNSRGAFLHLVSDALVSVAVLAGGIAVHFTRQYWIDPLLAVGVSIWLLRTTWPFLRETTDALLDAVPARQDLSRIEDDLRALPGVVAIHDLHVWPLGGDSAAASAHIVVSQDASVSDVLRAALDALHHDHPSLHATLQVEPQDSADWHGHSVCAGRE